MQVNLELRMLSCLTGAAVSRACYSSAILRSSIASTMPISTDCRKGPFNWISGRRVEPLDDIGTFDNVEPRYACLYCEVCIKLGIAHQKVAHVFDDKILANPK